MDDPRLVEIRTQAKNLQTLRTSIESTGMVTNPLYFIPLEYNIPLKASLRETILWIDTSLGYLYNMEATIITSLAKADSSEL